jgi:hypothetical protein
MEGAKGQIHVEADFRVHLGPLRQKISKRCLDVSMVSSS